MEFSSWLPRGIVAELVREEIAREPGKKVTIGSVQEMLDRWESERAFNMKVRAIEKAAEYHATLSEKLREAKSHIASKSGIASHL